jgi:hypothetical protein
MYVLRRLARVWAQGRVQGYVRPRGPVQARARLEAERAGAALSRAT